jgi:hypothetical protein
MYKKLAQYTLATISIVGLSLFTLVAMNLTPFAYAASNNQCIVTIAGKQYDLTALSSSHSGPQGNTLNGGTGFFKCGTDMTTTYQGMHGTDVSRIAQYLVVPTSTPTPTSIPTATPTTIPTGTVVPTSTPLPSVTPNPTSTVCQLELHKSGDNDDQDEVECETEQEKGEKEKDHDKKDDHNKGSTKSEHKQEKSSKDKKDD